MAARYGRARGKKFTTWRMDANGKAATIEVRAVEADSKFWVSMPGFNIDIESSDLAELKRQVELELSKQRPIEWTDYLEVSLTKSDGSFPRLTVASWQRGIDDAGNEYHRASSGEKAFPGWPEKDSMRNYREEVKFYVKRTDVATGAVASLKRAAAECFERLLTFFKVKYSGEGYDFKSEVNEKAVEVAIERISRDGLAIDVCLKD